jgi:hypothetical protein
MRRITATLLSATLLAFGVGCDNDDHQRDWDNTEYRGDRLSRDSEWDRTREREWDRHYRDQDWDRDRDRSAEHWRNDRRGEGLMDRDQDRSTWDRR